MPDRGQSPLSPDQHALVAASARTRYLKDSLARWVVWVGGLGVIAALLLIFFYLISEVIPLFHGAKVQARSVKVEAAAAPVLFSAVEEQGEIALQVMADGNARFVDLNKGEVLATQALPLNGLTVTEVSVINAEQGKLAALLSDGSVLMFAHQYDVSYPNDQRLITPSIAYPQGEAPLPFAAAGARQLLVRQDGDDTLIAAVTSAGQVQLKGQTSSVNPITEEAAVESTGEASFAPPVKADVLLIDPTAKSMYVIDRAQGKLAFYRLDGGSDPQLIEVVKTTGPIAAADFLAGGISLVIAETNRTVGQYFPARRADGETTYLAHARDFSVDGKADITAVGVELRRRTFAVGDADGNVSVFYSTSERELLRQKVMDGPVRRITFNPRAQLMLIEGEGGRLQALDVHNEHPEFSLKALWSKVWYESYDRPEWIWQSSSASSDFEAKFSFVPLAFGTLKAAFYAMIFAVPLAIMGAIFVANFMSPELRQVVKPTVELLAALPSVILGFLAGLWLAPLVETQLLGVLLLLVMLPLSVPIFGYCWLRMPVSIKHRVPAGYEGALLVPIIAVVVWGCFAIGAPIEAYVLGGNTQHFLQEILGIGYVQRNALVVGIAMGVAVVPTIFSIAEDAIFSVPKQLSLGSLALGASPWQTLVGVVLPTASPGIFSAVMIGLGRAVGETMIVLMATGNTPIVDASLFNGMRTLSANVAVEMPESEVGSTHFRLLFLAGLTLFIFTFFFNTVAEVVRTRMRKKFASI